MEKILTRTAIGTVAALFLVAVYSSVVGATTSYNSGQVEEYELKKEHGHHQAFGKSYLYNKVMLDFGKYVGQNTSTGETEVEGVNAVGNITTGDSKNSNATAVTLAVDNTGSSKAALQAGISWGSNTHSHTNSESSSESAASGGASGSSWSTNSNSESTMNMASEWQSQNTTVKNKTSAYIEEVTNQNASTGETEIEDSLAVGNVTTGDASNTNTTSVIFTVAN